MMLARSLPLDRLPPAQYRAMPTSPPPPIRLLPKPFDIDPQEAGGAVGAAAAEGEAARLMDWSPPGCPDCALPR